MHCSFHHCTEPGQVWVELNEQNILSFFTYKKETIHPISCFHCMARFGSDRLWNQTVLFSISFFHCRQYPHFLAVVTSSSKWHKNREQWRTWKKWLSQCGDSSEVRWSRKTVTERPGSVWPCCNAQVIQKRVPGNIHEFYGWKPKEWSRAVPCSQDTRCKTTS